MILSQYLTLAGNLLAKFSKPPNKYKDNLAKVTIVLEIQQGSRKVLSDGECIMAKSISNLLIALRGFCILYEISCLKPLIKKSYKTDPTT